MCSTIANYRSAIKEFYPFFIEYDESMVISTQKYLSWLETIKKNQYGTINKKISILKKYAQYLAITADISEHDYFRIKNIKRRKGSRLPGISNPYVLNRLRMFLKNTKLLNPQEKLIIQLVLNHGLTIKELVSINLYDIELSTLQITIGNSKRLHPRYVFLQKEDLLYLIYYIQYKQNRIKPYICCKLFQNSGRCISEYEIKKTFKKLSELLEINFTQRKLRNSCMKDLIDRGMDLIYVKTYFGLKSFKSLQKYDCINKFFLKHSKDYINTIRSNISSENTIKINNKIIRLNKKTESTKKQFNL